MSVFSNKPNIIVSILLIVIILITKLNTDLAWWFFLIPTFGLGIICAFYNLSIYSFSIGFICGFVIWFSANLYFDVLSNNEVLSAVGRVFHTGRFLLLISFGLMGGGLTGLSLYSGYHVLSKKK